MQIAHGAAAQTFILEASHASKPVVQLAYEEKGVIEWTAEEATALYQKALDRWANDRVVFDRSIADPSSEMAAGPIRETGTRLGKFLARVALPRMDWADEGGWKHLFDWLEELRAAGAFPTLALPYVLLRRPEEIQRITDVIAADIGSDRDVQAAEAAGAIRHWIALAKAGHTPYPAPAVLQALVERIIFRRKPGIESCIWYLANLIVENATAISESQADLLAASLKPWNEATLLPPAGPGEFDEAERPAVRARVAELAGALRLWYGSRSGEMSEPDSIAQWQKWCGSDPLPEVRRAFDIWKPSAVAS